MSASHDYIETCKNVINHIDPKELEQRRPQVVVADKPDGKDTCAVVGLGTVEFDDRVVHLAVKMNSKRFFTDIMRQRLRYELTAAEAIEDRAPGLTEELPTFMGLIATEGGAPLAIITEDASEGGQKPVVATSISQAARKQMEAGFDSIGVGLDEAELERTLAFDVGGHEKLLDLTPPPLRGIESSPAMAPYRARADENLNALTIVVGEHTPLADYILDRQLPEAA